MRQSYRDLIKTTLLGLALSAVAVSTVIFATDQAYTARQQRALNLAAERILERTFAGVVTMMQAEPSAFVYIDEDEILEGPMPLSQARSMQRAYRDAGAEVITAGTERYRIAVREMEKRKGPQKASTALQAIEQAVRD